MLKRTQMRKTPETVAEKLLVAAASISGTGRDAFTAEDLVVAAWERFPDTFGLQGYADSYPDSNRVLTYIMGSTKGLAGTGQIERVGEKTYRLTSAGLAAAASLIGGADEQQRAALDRRLITEVARLVEAVAFQKAQEGRRAQITEREALKFLGVSARSDGNKVRARLSDIEQAIAAGNAAVAAAQGTPLALDRGRRVVGAEDMADLQACYDYIREAFADELAQLLSR